LAGTQVQCLALAEAMGLQGVRKTLIPRLPWKKLPLSLWLWPLKAAGKGSDPIEPPWPDLVISCGRYAAGVSIGIKRASAGRTFTVHVQWPRIAARHFDVVVAPEHDGHTGDNVIVTHGSIHRVTEARLRDEAARFAEAAAHLPQPRVAVLVGGSNGRYRFEAAQASELAASLAAMARRTGAGLMVTVSRRTSPAALAALKQGLGDTPAWLWDGGGENPYFGFLGLADHVIVTGDSVNMASEACATGKPVHVVALPGRSARIERFHDLLRRQGRTRPFTGDLPQWSYEPLREAQGVAQEVWRRMGRSDH
jgi:mitochondrial fission protein ELM1